LFFFLVLAGSAAIPAPEKLLPDDTLVVVTVSGLAKLRELYRKSPQRNSGTIRR